MLVRVLRKHNNAFGDHYFKVAGDVYDHPSPGALIKAKKLEAADTPVPKARKRKTTRRKKA